METWTDEDGVNYVSCGVLEQGDYCGASYCEANIRALEGTEGAVVRHGAHHSRQLWLPDNDDNREIVRRLEDDYPVYDDEALSLVEEEWELEAWRTYGAADLCNRYRRDLDRTALADALEALDDATAAELYYHAAREANVYPTFEDSGAALHLDRIADAYARLLVERLIGAANPAEDDPAVLEHVANLDGCTFDLSDDAERLICADWCEDNGHGAALAAYLRLERSAPVSK